MAKINRKIITIIDGYNVINAWKELKEYINTDLEHARDLLIDKVVNYKYVTGGRVILVFDANYVKDNNGTKEKLKGIEIVYTREKVNADSYIEETVAKLAEDRRNIIKVVTYDYAEQQNILGSGAIRVTPEEFKYRLIDTEKRLKLIYVEEENKKTKTNLIEDVIGDEIMKKIKNLKVQL